MARIPRGRNPRSRSPRVVAIVAAAGSGKRVGGPTPKQFLKVGGRTILDHALARLGSHPQVDAMVAVVPADRVAEVEKLKRRHPRLAAVVAGGSRRQESVERGLDAAPGGEEAIVLVHDAARPLVSRRVVTDVIRAARTGGAAVPGVEPADTVKAVTPGGVVTRTLERADLRMIQTPQGFRASLLRRAHREANRLGRDATDDAGLVEAAGLRVQVVVGDPLNFKITTREDVERFRALLKQV